MDERLPESPSLASRRVLFGALAVLFYLTHGGYWVFWRGEPENLLWSCHLSSCLIGIGLLTRTPWLNATGVTWLAMGTPLWLLDVLTGGEFLPTSMGTHLGGLAVGLWGVRVLGFPLGTWWRASIAMLLLQQICRFITPFKTNVNLSQHVWDGWEATFPSYLVFWSILFTVCVFVYWSAEKGFRWLFVREPKPASGPIGPGAAHEAEAGTAGG